MLGTMLTGMLAGATLGFVVLLITVAIAQGKKSRAQTSLEHNGDLWPQIENWCKQHGYRLREEDGQRRLYQRGKGFWQAASRFQVTRNGNTWLLEGWLHMNALVITAELALDEKGVIAKVPRDKSKKDFNFLLGQLGAPAI
ncbi:hypothetical protein [Chitinilyticum piscinae]|uniref:Uncharacterized protein n=1 Tax=Chitinilyticum piscinae TaxID=2866724 RepID=A0A8J7KBA7_9NEIS|nr:hypothetical protein [Chitinilyticum piscinae]MBE9610039.1 hypothetical protein [Chitinilyticum piscinae]